MGASESKPPVNPVLARIEQEAVRAAVPKGLKDERSRQLEYELNWCYSRNNWFFTIGGLLVGGMLGYSMRSVQPVAWAAILSPAADWMYEQHACRELQEAYTEHQKKLRAEAHERAEKAKSDVREHFEKYGKDLYGEAGGPEAGGLGGGTGSQQADPGSHGGREGSGSGGSGSGLEGGRGDAAIGAGAQEGLGVVGGEAQVRRSWWWGGRKKAE